MSLFQKKEFFSHSGELLDFKIECDALTEEDLETFVYLIGSRYGFKRVIGIPKGGERLAEALKEYEDPEMWSTLIVDDVLTTGGSMEEARLSLFAEDPEITETNVMGVVLFSRMYPDDVPSWIKPIFQIWKYEHPDRWLQETIEKDMKGREKV